MTERRTADSTPIPPVETTNVDADHPESSRWFRRLEKSSTLFMIDACAVGIGALLTGSLESWVAFFFAFLVALQSTTELYRWRLTLSLYSDFPILSVRFLAAITLTICSEKITSSLNGEKETIEWHFIFSIFIIWLTMLVFRGSFYSLVRTVRRAGLVANRTVILGGGRVAMYLAETLMQHPQYGLAPVGHLDIDPPRRGAVEVLPNLGRPEQLVEVLLDYNVRNVVIAFGSLRESELIDIVRTCDRLLCEIYVVPRLFEVQALGPEFDSVWGLPLVRLKRRAHRSQSWRLKRIFDIVISVLALVALSPLILMIALLVRIECGSDVLVREERVGWDGQHFMIFKFRTIRDRAVDPVIGILPREAGAIGRILRRSSIEDLPQLLNVLMGTMSLIGPSPETPRRTARFRSDLPHYTARHRVNAGLGGFAQVHGLKGDDTSISERARFDNYYIESWSLALDFNILLRSVMSFLFDKSSHDS